MFDLKRFIQKEQRARGWPIEDWTHLSDEEIAEKFGISVGLWQNLRRSAAVAPHILGHRYKRGSRRKE